MDRGAPTPSRADEAREEEGAVEGEPDVDARPGVTEAEARAELARHIQPSVFPADRDRLIASAVELHAPPAVLSTLRTLPGGQRFRDAAEVWASLERA